MSAFKWLTFGMGVVILAVLYAILTEFVTPAIDILKDLSTTQASSQGITWYSEVWSWFPLVLLLLLVFMVMVGVIVRRRSVVAQ